MPSANTKAVPFTEWCSPALNAAEIEFVRLYPRRSNTTYSAIMEIARIAKRIQAAK